MTNKEFNIDAALSGAAVENMAGDPVRILLADGRVAEYPVVALVSRPGQNLELPMLYSRDGKAWGHDGSGEDDGLRMCRTPVERRAYTLLFRRQLADLNCEEGNRFTGGKFYATREEAEAVAARLSSDITLIGVAEIRWSETGFAVMSEENAFCITDKNEKDND